MITAVQISEDLKAVYWKDDKGVVHGEPLTDENRSEWIDLYCKLQNY
jgi:hypothetical protein